MPVMLVVQVVQVMQVMQVVSTEKRGLITDLLRVTPSSSPCDSVVIFLIYSEGICLLTKLTGLIIENINHLEEVLKTTQKKSTNH